MKHALQRISLFDAFSTFTVLIGLSILMIFGSGGIHQAQADGHRAAAEVEKKALIDDTDRPTGVNEHNDNETIKEKIMRFVNYLLTFLGLVAVLIFIWAGVLMLISAGNDEQVTSAKTTMTWAAIGILVILFSYIIVNFIIDAGKGLEPV